MARQDNGPERRGDRRGPAKGWKDILKRVWKSLATDRVLLVAAGVTFYLLLALFPALASFVAIYGLFLDPSNVADHVAALQGVAPPAVTELVGGQLQRLSAQRPGTLGLGAAAGLLVALWSTNGGVKAIFEGLNIAYDERETRSFLRLNFVALAFTLGAMVLILVIIAALAVVPAVLAFLPLGRLGETLVGLVRWPVLLVAVGVALGLLYRFGPSRQPPAWRWVTWGSAFATLGWIAASVGFSVYLENFADFSASYGAMAAPIAVLLWLWISMVVILIGAELNAEVEGRTDRDTTTGQDRPMDGRGASLADTRGDAAD